MTERIIPDGFASPHSTGPLVTNGLIGLGGQKARPVVTQKGRTSRSACPADQNGAFRSFSVGEGKPFKGLGPLKDQGVAATRYPHRGLCVRHLTAPCFAAQLQDQLAQLAPAVDLGVRQLSAIRVGRQFAA